MIAHARATLEHPALAVACSVALLLFYALTAFGRPAFGVPFMVVWAILVAAFFAGWAYRRAAVGRMTESVVALAGLAGAGAAGIGWYLLIRRVLGVEREVAMWSAAVVVAAVALGFLVRWKDADVPASRWLLPAQVIAAWVALRSHMFTEEFGLYDFYTYVGSSTRFTEGMNPYLAEPLRALPPTALEDAFLYPPPLLPPAAALSALPEPLRSQLWIVVLVVSGIIAMRLLGMPWRWAAVMLAFPPLVKGIESGNIANLTFVVFAAGAVVPAALALGLLFKPQGAIALLWLVREWRWRSVVIGVLALGVIGLVTLPLVGIENWFNWAAGLRHREESQHAFPLLYGYSLAQYLPIALFAAIALVAVVVALMLRGRRSLAALGLATVLASPALWPHGFLFALPAVLGLQAPLMWLTLGLADGPWLWLMVPAGYLGLAAGRWGQPAPPTLAAHPTHAAGPWPARPVPAAPTGP